MSNHVLSNEVALGYRYVLITYQKLLKECRPSA
jgi:hypothetical protein